MTSRFERIESFDESIFRDSDKCNESNPQLKECHSVKRVIYALKYYMNLNGERGTEGMDIFTDFIKSKYKNYHDYCMLFPWYV